jgi:hypothetical protein
MLKIYLVRSRPIRWLDGISISVKPAPMVQCRVEIKKLKGVSICVSLNPVAYAPVANWASSGHAGRPPVAGHLQRYRRSIALLIVVREVMPPLE